ncbi:MAG: FAD-dependent oxidoreductase [Runella sp.]
MKTSRRRFLEQSTALSLLSLSDTPVALPMNNTIYDIIIIGAGTAGMPCAIAAAQKGAKVLVIEKSDKVGGTLHLTGGHMSAGGTRHQHRKGVEDTPQAHYDDVMRISQHTAPADIVRLAVNEAPHTIDWLESLGFEFAPESPRIVYGHVPYHVARTQYGKEAGISIFKALKPLWDKYVASQNIELKLHTSLSKLWLEKGKVVGVETTHKEKRESFKGKSVVLAAGGYAANPTFFAQKHPHHPRLITTAAPTSTGEVIAIAEQAGAQFWNADTHISSLGGIEFEPQSHQADFWQGWAMVFTTSYRPAREIYVNDLGHRFMDESNPDPDYRERAVAQQPQKRFWVIFDENALQGRTSSDNADTGYVNVDKTTVANAPMTIVPKWTVEQIKQYAQEGKFLWTADSIAALAQKTGLPEANLEKAVAQFNQYAHEGNDKDFGRKDLKYRVEKGPFYALLTYATSLISFGGLKINTQLQVLNHQNQPIPNLYAAGEIIGAGATTGNAFCGGMLVTPAISFGRILGKKLASQ